MTTRTGYLDVERDVPWDEPTRPISLPDLAVPYLVRPPTSEQARDARRVVAARAVDVEDCRELLAMLDLLPDGAA